MDTSTGTTFTTPPITETTTFNRTISHITNNSTINININNSFETLSYKWGLFETYLELPLTLITVLIIFSSYTFILKISKEQNKKLTNYSKKDENINKKDNSGNKETDDKVIKSKRNQIAPAPDILKTQHQQPSIISSNVIDESESKSGHSKEVPYFADLLELPSNVDKNTQSPSISSENNSKTNTDIRNSVVSLSWSDLSRRDVTVSFRKYSLPDGHNSQNKKTNHSEMNFHSNSTKHYNNLHYNNLHYNNLHYNNLQVLTLFDDTQNIYKKRPSVHKKRPSVQDSGVSNTSTEYDKNNQVLEVFPAVAKSYDFTTLENENDKIESPNTSKDEPDDADKRNENSTITKQCDDKTESNVTDVVEQTSVEQDKNSVTITKTIDVYEMDGTKHTEQIQTKPTGNDKTLDGAVCLMTNKNRIMGRRRVELKAAFKVVAIFCCFVIFWLPLPVSITIMRSFVTSKRYRSFMNVTAILSSLATSTAAMDSIVYGLLNQHIVDGLINLNKNLRRRLISFWTR